MSEEVRMMGFGGFIYDVSIIRAVPRFCACSSISPDKYASLLTADFGCSSSFPS